MAVTMPIILEMGSRMRASSNAGDYSQTRSVLSAKVLGPPQLDLPAGRVELHVWALPVWLDVPCVECAAL